MSPFFTSRTLLGLFTLTLLALPALYSAFAQEQTTIGSACPTVGQNRTDWDSIIQCTATGWQYAQLVTATPTANNHVATKAYVDAASGGGSWQVQEFTTSATWTKPANVTSVSILAVGGGGGGGGCPASTTAGGGGGGGGSTIWAPNVPVSANLYVSVGTAGSGGIYQANGTSGTNTIISQGGTTLVSATAGTGGYYTGQGGYGGGCAGGRAGFIMYSLSQNGATTSYEYALNGEDGESCNGGGGGGGGTSIQNGVGVSQSIGGRGGGNTVTFFSTGRPGLGSTSYGGGGGASFSGAGGDGGGGAATGYGSGGGGSNGSCYSGGAGAPGYARIYWQQ